ncbi:RidA family protein [Pseudooceanicola sp. 216_PA32_1]|uniref:RidA family protein n=1 Tax=Pseudooceanicola pacificus TaxID=2676438 RepID=A0A844WDH0_9RHOB|nr:RidA family protein [Pseudooceanicola pacificus]MWB76859.1 RidA family protein [Pseudooceanicola pacificus]
MPDKLNPQGIAAPFGAYSHGIAAGPVERIVVTSGQLGLAADGSLAPDAAGQARQCFANITAILAEAGMTAADVLRINAFVTRREDFPAYMAERDRWLEGVEPRPASTLVIVTGFTRPEFLVEVEATAAR